MDIRIVLGNNIKNFREIRGYTIETLSNEAGIAFSTLSTIERGLSNTSLDILEKLAIALNVTVSDLLELDADIASVVPCEEPVFKHMDQFRELPPEDRKIINHIVGLVLRLMTLAYRRGRKNDTDSDV